MLRRIGVRIIRRITTEPPWSTREPFEDELILRGRNRSALWGFGQHPATSLCLSILTGMYDEQGPQPKRVVELACGSGLLCIAAGNLGATDAIGIETDLELRAIAAENARANRPRSLRMVATIDELDGLPELPRDALEEPEARQFDLTIANLAASELHANADVLAKLAARGHLLIAGFVEEEREALEQKFGALGFRFLYREAREGFLASVFKSRAGDAPGAA